MVEDMSRVEVGLRSIKSSAVRARNLQQMCNDLDGFMRAVEFRLPHTFIGKVGQFFSDLAHKIKSFFG